VVVTTAETTPVNESIELISAIREVGVALAGAVVNAVEPDELLTDLSDEELAALPNAVADTIRAAIDRHENSTADVERFVEALEIEATQVVKLPTAELGRDHISRLAIAAFQESGS
jgi:ribosomal protein S13